MHSKETFQKAIADELPHFMRVFESIPQDKEREVVQMAQQAMGLLALLKTDSVEVAAGQEINSFAAAVVVFRQAFEELPAVAVNVSDQDWATREETATHLLLNLVHRRDQLASDTIS